MKQTLSVKQISIRLELTRFGTELNLFFAFIKYPYYLHEIPLQLVESKKAILLFAHYSMYLPSATRPALLKAKRFFRERKTEESIEPCILLQPSS